MSPEKKPKSVMMMVRMDEGLSEKAKTLAESRGISLAGLVRMLLIREIEANEAKR
jgi:predicted HicB family RNase H-like nuclease